MLTKKQLIYKTIFYKVLITLIFLTYILIFLSINEPNRPLGIIFKEDLAMSAIWLPISFAVYFLYDYIYFKI